MFHLLRLRDVIELEAAYLPRPDKDEADGKKKAKSGDAAAAVDANKYRPSVRDLIWHRTTEKYVNKIIANQGLCVAVDEIEESSSGCIRGNEGSAWSNIEFTVVIFRPSVGQRIAAVIASQDAAGITLSLSFFAVFVPSHQLMANSHFDKSKGQWYVTVEDEEEGDKSQQDEAVAIVGKDAVQAKIEANRNYYKTGDDVLVAIENVFVRTLSDTGMSERLAPMEVLGSFSAADGLGPRSWYE